MKLHRSRRLAVALAAGSLALTGCYSDANQGNVAVAADGALSGRLAGAGSSAQAAAMQAWIAAFQTSNPGVTVNYDPVGSGGGRDQFTAGGVAFAGSDRALTLEEIEEAKQRCADGASVVDLPLYISPIAVAFNLDGIDELNLDAETIAKIFNQEITRWNDPVIVAQNPGVELPDLAITPVNRQDDSGTTENFTEYLAAAAPQAWPYEPDGIFPVEGGESATGTSGVVQAVTAGQGAIGYADASQIGSLGTVSVKVGEEYVEYTPQAAAAVVASSPREEGRAEGDLAIEVDRTTTESGNYPIVLVSYLVACTQYDDPAQGQLVNSFLSFVASETGQQIAAGAAGAAPISDELRTEVNASVSAIR